MLEEASGAGGGIGGGSVACASGHAEAITLVRQLLRHQGGAPVLRCEEALREASALERIEVAALERVRNRANALQNKLTTADAGTVMQCSSISDAILNDDEVHAQRSCRNPSLVTQPFSDPSLDAHELEMQLSHASSCCGSGPRLR